MKATSYWPLAKLEGSIRRLAVMALAGIGFAPALASEFYKLTIIAESSQVGGGSDWRIIGGGGGLNNAGFVTWRADRAPTGVFENGIFFGNGSPASTPASPGTPIAIGTVSAPSINNANQGQVAFLSGLTARLWDRATGTTSDLYNCSQQPNPIPCPGDTTSRDATFSLRTAFGVWGVYGVGGQRQFGVDLPNTFTTFTTDSAISRSGRNAAAAGRDNTTNTVVIGALDTAIPGLLGLATLGPLSAWSIQGVSTNDSGAIAFLSTKGASTTIRSFVGVVNPRVDTTNLIRIADDSGGRFRDFGAAGRGPAINNLNEVAFPATLPNLAAALPFVGDVSGRPPTLVAAANEPIPDSNGAIFVGIDQRGVNPQALNDKGSFAFHATIRRANTNLSAVIRADPIEGVSPGNPIMPSTGNPLPRGWRFPLTCLVPSFCTVAPVVGAGAPRTPRRYIDPQLAVGYTYQVEAPGPNFASVYVPAPLPNGDALFQVEFNGQVTPLRAGEEFDFTAVVPGGVSTFRITGIDTTEVLDPANPSAFVTGLTFAADSSTDYSVTMVPIIADPDDTDLDGVPNAADLCPNTPEGAAVDSNGCSASQRDSDGDGVVDSLDQCPATPVGTPVNANGCSAQQLDADGDGVPNAVDLCPGTAPGDAVNAQGCSASQRDSDGDGVNDSLDRCPNTPAGAAVDSAGCSAEQRDSDGDGVPDNLDRCPGTAAGAAVDANGCSAAQRDTDGDGVADSVDLCPGTPAGTRVDANGCPVPTTTATCDVNGDGSIDYRDIRSIILGNGKPASGPTDPRDANRNGKIDLADAAICTSKCSRWLCLPPK